MLLAVARVWRTGDFRRIATDKRDILAPAMTTRMLTVRRTRAPGRGRVRPRRIPLEGSTPPGLPGRRLAAADVLALQGLVGNQGAQRAIQRQQQERTGTAATPAGPAGATAVPGHYLPDERRDTLRHQVTLRLATAYTDYALACEEVKRDLAEEIEQNTEIAMLVVGVFLGPVGGAAGRLFHDYLNNLPTTASTVATRAALLTLDHEEQIRSFADERPRTWPKGLLAPSRGANRMPTTR